MRNLKNTAIRFLFAGTLMASCFSFSPLPAKENIESISHEGMAMPSFEEKIPDVGAKVAGTVTPVTLDGDLLAKPRSEGIPRFSMMRSLISFIFVASLIVAAGIFFKGRFGGAQGFLKDFDSPVRLLQTISVGVKRQLLVIDFGGTEILVGVAGNQMQLLHVKPETRAASILPASNTSGSVPGAVGGAGISRISPGAARTLAKQELLASRSDPPQGEKKTGERKGLSEQILKMVRNLRPLEKRVH